MSIKLTPTQKRILFELRGTTPGEKTVSRAELRKRLGVGPGLYKLMGAPTKEGHGTARPDNLEALGLVASEVMEDKRGIWYALTEKGYAVLAELEKQGFSPKKTKKQNDEKELKKTKTVKKTNTVENEPPPGARGHGRPRALLLLYVVY